MAQYAKALVALGLALLTAIGTALADNTISGAEWIGVGIALLTAVGVWTVPNTPPASTPPRRME